MTTLAENWFPTCAVFDCDGVLLDSESRWNQVQRQVFADYGAHMSPELEKELTGSAPSHVAQVLAKLTCPKNLTLAEHQRQVLDHIVSIEDQVVAGGVDPIPGALEALSKLAKVLPLAVASNSSQALLTRKLTTYRYAPYLKTWVGADSVAHPKPAPDIYQEAIRRLGGDPARTLTVEDSILGAQAAQAAGTATLIFGSDPQQPPKAQGFFDSFKDPDFLAQLDQWIRRAQTVS
ncbi:MAG: HAD family phosphatase [Rothia sp. (in: high G+C Gram-positive bacteria)]|nr:HAD family phosphatase [Rothia sp. (in: high G+C Gram-positive bacteria)]